MKRHAFVLVFFCFVSATRVLANGAWTPLTNLSEARSTPMMIELLDGRVAVVGGWEPTGGSTAMDIYDPRSRSWSPGGSLVVPRAQGALVRLRDGRLLLASGTQDGDPIPESEIYDPATNLWTLNPQTDELSVVNAGAVTLADGRVLMAGGFGRYWGEASGRVAFFDPATLKWTRSTFMREGRGCHNLVLLRDGRVLAVGGYSADDPDGWQTTASAEIFDPATNAWTPAASMAAARAEAFATLLPDGRVLVAGGRSRAFEPPIATAEIYDPVANAWSPAPSLTMPRARPMGGVMFDERVIIVSNDAASGGISGEEYVPGTGTWTPIAAPSISAPDSTALIFNGGQNMLVAGGFRRPDVYFASAEAYKLNHRPVAVATIANPTTQAVPGSLAGVNVSAAGSTDADADHLTYTWTAGNTVLARTTDPTLNATLGLAIGSHTITLTVSDIFGETSTAIVTASVTDGTGGTADLVRALQEELRQARQRAAVCELTIGTANTAAELALGLQFGNASFKLPGPTPALKLGAFVVAALTTPSSCQKDMYRTLGGKK